MIKFDSRFRGGSKELIFMHHVDRHAASVQVLLLNHGLSQTFSYNISRMTKTKENKLNEKTAGFLAVVTPSQERVVLAWAQSGYKGKLIPNEYILGNASWASKVIKLAKTLDLGLASPFGKPTAPHGSYQASHVEVKLATYATTLLLRQTSRCETTEPTRENLLHLRGGRWIGGHPLRFEIYISRKHCSRCQCFLRKLQDLTGVRYDIRGEARVAPMKYEQQGLKAGDEIAFADGGAGKQSVPKLQTYEQDGVIHYIPLTEVTQDRRPRRGSPPELSDVDKPLPATAVTEDPYASSSTNDRSDR